MKLYLCVFFNILICVSSLEIFHFISNTTDQLRKNIRKVNDKIIHNPVVMAGQNQITHALVDGGHLLTALPLALKRNLHTPIDIPKILNDRNIAEYSRQVVEVFNVKNPDSHLSTDKLIIKHNYRVEVYETSTDDGYILTMYRMPNKGRPAVFLMHGLEGSSDDYIINGPESGLAFLLFNEGYDVWLGNARGNKYSRKHKTLKPTNSDFWDYSWHEIGFYDLPAMIDFALATTNLRQIKYIGHSQGTTSFFVMASEHPKFNEKISIAVALSPIVYMSKTRAPFVRMLLPLSNIVFSASKLFGLYEFAPDDAVSGVVRHALCGQGPISELICGNIVILACGFSFHQTNITNLPVILDHFPSGASGKCFEHYAQLIISKEFLKFDYGSNERNSEKYESEKPPKYNLSNVKCPVALFYSKADWFAHPDNVHELSKRISNMVDLYEIPFDPFNHLDFVLAKDTKTLLFDRIKSLFDKY